MDDSLVWASRPFLPPEGLGSRCFSSHEEPWTLTARAERATNKLLSLGLREGGHADNELLARLAPLWTLRASLANSPDSFGLWSPVLDACFASAVIASGSDEERPPVKNAVGKSRVRERVLWLADAFAGWLAGHDKESKYVGASALFAPDGRKTKLELLVVGETPSPRQAIEELHSLGWGAISGEDAGRVCVRGIGEVQSLMSATGATHPFHPRATFGPLRSGISIGATSPTQHACGTLGFFVRDGQGVHYLVSCEHVLAAYSPLDGISVVHPAPVDCQPALPLTIGQGVQRADPKLYLDLAVAKLTAEMRLDHLARLSSGGAITGVVDSLELPRSKPMEVYKVGRATGVSEGLLHATRATVRVVDDLGRRRLLIDHVWVESTEHGRPFAERGDSGALVLDMKNQLVGMVVAGVASPNTGDPLSSPDFALVTPIGLILNALSPLLGSGVSLVTA